MITDVWTMPLGALLLGYLLGSIPFGLILTKAGGAGDLRALGSGNIGATNVLRTGRKGLAAATLLLDAAKGAVAVLLFALIDDSLAALAGFAAFIGHLYPIWLRFRGGKGVATLLGVTLALAWPVGLVFALVWVVVLAFSRYSSVGGMSAAAATPIAAAAFGRFDLTIIFLACAMLVLLKHRGNITRLLDGTEPKVGSNRAPR